MAADVAVAPAPLSGATPTRRSPTTVVGGPDRPHRVPLRCPVGR